MRSRRNETINSWHIRSDAYDRLVKNYQLLPDMAKGLVGFIENGSEKCYKNMHVMDLAAGTGLLSKILIDRLHLSPSSIHLVEPAAQMCAHARHNIKSSFIHQVAAEDCLSIPDLPRDYFEFILCNASMHLMSETDIYPIVSKLLKKKGCFLYTLWYHAFDETQHFSKDKVLETAINDALTAFSYPKYFSTAITNKTTSGTNRSRGYLKAMADRNGLKLESCTIHHHRTPISFDLDFMLMTPNWLTHHLKLNESNQSVDVHVIRERIIEHVRVAIKDKFTDVPVVQIVVSKV